MLTRPPQSAFLDADAGDLEELRALVEVSTDPGDCPQAIRIEQNVPVYSGDTFRAAIGDDAVRSSLLSELNHIFSDGPGIVAISGGISDLDALDRATALFNQMIEDERGQGGGDHFAKPGANDRVWNVLQKHCLADPENFISYFGTPAIDLPSRAWLGDGYQMTAQVNRVNPGGAAQTAHRDYHLGFMDPARVATYPRQVHALSPLLTLQGAVAHVDMPLETGPTLYLPHSQKFLEGYVAFGRPEFQDYFAQHRSQLPLEKGDIVFFNPAVMHGSGDNVTTDRHRMANLMQVSSAFGRSLEAVDRTSMCKALYPALRGAQKTTFEANCAIAAAAEGYAFPTNLDTDPPVGGLIPESQAELLIRALREGWETARLTKALDAQEVKKRP